MSYKINKPTDEELASVSGGGGAVYNRGNISNPDKIFGSNCKPNRKTEGLVNPFSSNSGNHEFEFFPENNGKID